MPGEPNAQGWSKFGRSCSRLCCPLRATPVNLALPDYRTNGLLPAEVELEERPNRVKLVSEVGLADRIGSSGLCHPNQPEPTSPPPSAHLPSSPPPWGSYVRGDLSIVSTSNLPVEGQIDVANFSVALFASQITRLSYAESSLFLSDWPGAAIRNEQTGRRKCFISSMAYASVICRWHASGKEFFAIARNDNRLTSVGYDNFHGETNTPAFSKRREQMRLRFLASSIASFIDPITCNILSRIISAKIFASERSPPFHRFHRNDLSVRVFSKNNEYFHDTLRFYECARSS